MRALILVAVALALAGCSEPGRVVGKTTEGAEVTGRHYVHCARQSGATTKDLTPYDEFRVVKIGDPC